MENKLHYGYVDGLSGKEPISDNRNYEYGWLAGAKDREEGKAPPRFLGRCNVLPFNQWDIVTIPKGTPIHSMSKGNIIAKRTFKVKIYSICNGYDAYQNDDGNIVITNPKIMWAGAGGYWHETDVNNLLEANNK